ncbi:MAG: phosphoribosylformylglycinamidine synthase subunit PurS [Leptospirales bacterium]
MNPNSSDTVSLVKATILIRVREGILDPQGQAVLQAFQDMGENDLFSVRIGKLIEIVIPSADALEARIESWCQELLSNPLVESYEIQRIEPVSHQPMSM